MFPLSFTVNRETTYLTPQRTKAVNEWRGIAQFCGMILDVGDKFTQAVAAFDKKKCFSHAAFKESARLPRSYCLQLPNWVASARPTINTNTFSQKLRNLKCLYHVRSHVFCQGNPEIHNGQHMLVAIYSHSLFPRSTALRRTVSLSTVKLL